MKIEYEENAKARRNEEPAKDKSVLISSRLPSRLRDFAFSAAGKVSH